MANLTSIDGNWAGGCTLGGHWIYLKVRFAGAQGWGQGTFGTIWHWHEESELEGLRWQLPLVQFRLTRWRQTMSFEGRYDSTQITGRVTRGDDSASFRLVRVSDTDLNRTIAEVSGCYELEPGRFVSVGLLTEFVNSLAYTDWATGRVAQMYPSSQNSFFSGPGLQVPYPKDVEIAFSQGADGRANELTWSEKGARSLKARKVHFTQEEVRFASDDVTLSGTLTKPLGEGPHPAIVCVHGSGPQPRGGSWPLPDLFAYHGAAVLTYDKRGVGGSTGDWQQASLDDLTRDALAGVRLLKERPDIRPDRIGMFGISQAGWIEPWAAARSSDVAFIIVMSGSGTPGYLQDIYRQTNWLRAFGVPEPDVIRVMNAWKLLYDYLLWGKSKDVLDAAVAELQKDPETEDMAPCDSNHIPPFMRKFGFEFDPTPVWEKVKCPVLLLYGETDSVVDTAVSVPLISAALRRGGASDVTVKVFPNCGHMLWVVGKDELPGTPNSPGFAPNVGRTVAEWLEKHTGADH